MLDKSFQFADSLQKRLVERQKLRNVAITVNESDDNFYLAENAVQSDLCSQGKLGSIFTCNTTFVCKSSHNCSQQYILCPQTPTFTCSGGTFGCLGNTIYECATFQCGLEGSSQTKFECTASTAFACNGLQPHNCLYDFSCQQGYPGFACTTAHDCASKHQCGQSNTAGSFVCGQGTGQDADNYDCKTFECSGAKQGDKGGGFLCQGNTKFDCATQNSGSFDCWYEFGCLKNNGVTCNNNNYKCHNSVECAQPVGCIQPHNEP